MTREESIDIDDKFDFNLAKFIIKTRWQTFLIYYK